MDLALKTAENAGKAGEVPIGCVIVRDNEVIAAASREEDAEKRLNLALQAAKWGHGGARHREPAHDWAPL